MNTVNAAEFWTYSLSLYQKDSVAQHCLHLQDTFDCNVNVFLFCCWLTSQQLNLSAAGLQSIAAGIKQQDEQLKVFRIQRRAAKLTHPETYQHLKQQELGMEQVQQGLIVQLYNNVHRISENSGQLITHNPIASFIAYYKLSKLQTDDWVNPLLRFI